MKVRSVWWDEANGVCLKHMLPSVPCPECMSGEGDKDLVFVVSDNDLDVIAFEELFGNKLTLEDLVPSNIVNPTFA